MTDWYLRLTASKRISVFFWLLNTVLMAGLLAFAARGWL